MQCGHNFVGIVMVKQSILWLLNCSSLADVTMAKQGSTINESHSVTFRLFIYTHVYMHDNVAT